MSPFVAHARLFLMLPRKAGAGAGRKADAGGAKSSGKRMPQLDDFLSTNDFVGATTLLDFQRRTEDADALTPNPNCP